MGPVERWLGRIPKRVGGGDKGKRFAQRIAFVFEPGRAGRFGAAMGYELVTAFEAADAAKEQDLRGYYPLAARLLADEVRRLRTEVDLFSTKYFDAKSAVRCAQNWILGGDESGRGEVLELLGTESGLGPNV